MTDENRPQEWKTLRSFEFPVHAEMAQMFLRNNGIESRLLNDKLIAVDWFLSNALGGVKLQVAFSDFIKADELLKAADNQEFALDDSVVEGVPCPKCQSTETEIHSHQKKGLALLFTTYSGIPLPFLLREEWKCLKCAHQWESRRSIQWSAILTISLVIAMLFFLVKKVISEFSQIPM